MQQKFKHIKSKDNIIIAGKYDVMKWWKECFEEIIKVWPNNRLIKVNEDQKKIYKRQQEDHKIKTDVTEAMQMLEKQSGGKGLHQKWWMSEK